MRLHQFLLVLILLCGCAVKRTDSRVEKDEASTNQVAAQPVATIVSSDNETPGFWGAVFDAFSDDSPPSVDTSFSVDEDDGNSVGFGDDFDSGPSDSLDSYEGVDSGSSFDSSSFDSSSDSFSDGGGI